MRVRKPQRLCCPAHSRLFLARSGRRGQGGWQRVEVDRAQRDEQLHTRRDHRAPPSARTTCASSAPSNQGVTRTRATPTSTTMLPSAAADGTRGTAGTTRSGPSRPSWLAHHRNVDASNPLPAANTVAARPLARHARTRAAHFRLVVAFTPASLPPSTRSRKAALSCSGYRRSPVRGGGGGLRNLDRWFFSTTTSISSPSTKAALWRFHAPSSRWASS